MMARERESERDGCEGAAKFGFSWAYNGACALVTSVNPGALAFC